MALVPKGTLVLAFCGFIATVWAATIWSNRKMFASHTNSSEIAPTCQMWSRQYVVASPVEPAVVEAQFFGPQVQAMASCWVLLRYMNSPEAETDGQIPLAQHFQCECP